MGLVTDELGVFCRVITSDVLIEDVGPILLHCCSNQPVLEPGMSWPIVLVVVDFDKAHQHVDAEPCFDLMNGGAKLVACSKVYVGSLSPSLSSFHLSLFPASSSLLYLCSHGSFFSFSSPSLSRQMSLPLLCSNSVVNFSLLERSSWSANVRLGTILRKHPYL